MIIINNSTQLNGHRVTFEEGKKRCTKIVGEEGLPWWEKLESKHSHINIVTIEPIPYSSDFYNNLNFNNLKLDLKLYSRFLDEEIRYSPERLFSELSSNITEEFDYASSNATMFLLFNDIRKKEESVYNETTETHQVTEEVPLLDADGEKQYNSNGDLITETVDVLDENGDPVTEEVVVDRIFVETIVTYQKRAMETQLKTFTEYEQVEQQVMEEQPLLDADGNEQYDENDELITETVGKTEEKQVLNETTGEYETQEVPVMETIEKPVEVQKEVEVEVWNDFTTEFEQILKDIDNLITNHESVDLDKLKKEIKQYRWEKQQYYTYYNHLQRFEPYDVQRMNDIAELLKNGDINEIEWTFADDSTKTIADYNYLINLKNAGYQNEQKCRAIEKQLLQDSTVNHDNYKQKFDELLKA